MIRQGETERLDFCTETKGYSLKLDKANFDRDCIGSIIFSTIKLEDTWNALLETTVNSYGVSELKKKIDRYGESGNLG